MASMNKPAANSTTWYQDLTDNWTSIENNLIDKSLLTTKGDLIGASGSSTPVRVAAGADGRILTADSTQSSGVRWGVSTNLPSSSYMTDFVLDKRFFSAAGLLPGTQYYETSADTAPTVDFDTSGVSSTTIGNTRRWPGVTANKIVGWDLGANRQTILLLIPEFQDSGAVDLMFMSTALPTPPATDVSGNGYAAGNNSYNSGYIFIVPGFNGLSPTNFVTYSKMPFGQAMLFNNGNIRVFYRYGNAQWMEGTYKNDGTYTSLRYVGVRMGTGDFTLGPVGVYYA